MTDLIPNGFPYFYPDGKLEEHYWIIPLCISGTIQVEKKPSHHIIFCNMKKYTNEPTTFSVKAVKDGWLIEYQAYGNMVVNTATKQDAYNLARKQSVLISTGVEEIDLENAIIRIVGTPVMIDDERVREYNTNSGAEVVRYETE